MLAVALTLVLSGNAISRQGALAPDGRRGFGAETEENELLRVFHSSREEDEDFLFGLLQVSSDVLALVKDLEHHYRVTGYFGLLGPRVEEMLSSLHDAYRGAEAEARVALSRPDRFADPFAHMVFDERFQARMDLLEGWELETREVRSGVRVLGGATDGYVTFEEGEAQMIARRVDLGASLLRALRSDLQALRPPIEAQPPDLETEARVSALVSLARNAPRQEWLAGWEQMRLRRQSRVDRMSSALFTTRLHPKVEDALAWRRELLLEAERFRWQAMTYLPETDLGRSAPREIAELSKSKRLRFAGYQARKGLAFDPLDEELVYAAAHSTDFFFGATFSHSLYDRFLALRGIRVHDHRTLRERELTGSELEAVAIVRNASTLGR